MMIKVREVSYRMKVFKFNEVPEYSDYFQDGFQKGNLMILRSTELKVNQLSIIVIIRFNDHDN